MFIGRIEHEPWLEIAAEAVDHSAWEVFHAMILTPRVAAEVRVASAGSILPTITGQRPFKQSRYEREVQR